MWKHPTTAIRWLPCNLMSPAGKAARMNLLIAPGVVMPTLGNSRHYSSIWKHGRVIGLNKPLLHNFFWGIAKSLSEAKMWDECDKTHSQLLHRSTSAPRPRVGADSTFWPSRLLSIPSIPLHLPSRHRRGPTWLVLSRQWGSATRGHRSDAGKSSAVGDAVALQSQHLRKS